MAQIKYCKKCNTKISIREMPNGVWLPFDYQTNELHSCKEKKELKKTSKQLKIEEAIETKKDLLFNDSKKDMYIITPTKIENGYIEGYNIENELQKYKLEKIYNIQILDSKADKEKKISDYNEKKYGIEYSIIDEETKGVLTKFYVKYNYYKLLNISEDEVEGLLNEIEMLLVKVKCYNIDITELRKYSLVNLEKHIDISLDKLLKDSIVQRYNEIKKEKEVRIEEEKKQREVEKHKAEQENIKNKIISTIFYIVLIYFIIKWIF